MLQTVQRHVNMESAQVDVSLKQHHVKAELCLTRARYREGRHLKAVKVYTINQESKYLLVQGIPSVGAHEDLIKMFESYGHLAEQKFLDEYPSEKFTEVLLIKYKQIYAARLAKRKLDDFNFYGGTLHVCYAPEYENVQETREKLEDRRKAVSARIRKLDQEKKETLSTDKDEDSKLMSRDSNPKTLMLHQKQPTSDKPWIENFGEPPTSDHSNTATNLKIRPSDTDNAVHLQTITNETEARSSDILFSNSADNTPNQGSLSKIRNVYPSQDQENYRGSYPIQQQPKPKSQDSKPEKLIVRPFKSKASATPRFVPRQVDRTRVKKFGGINLQRNSTKTLMTDTKPDPINEKLRNEALTLGRLAGPELPKEEKMQRESFKRAATTGDEILEKTAIEIRNKVQKFCEVAVPLQVKKKRRK